MTHRPIDRRTFLKGCTLSAAGLLIPASGLFVPDVALAQEQTRDAFWTRDRVLSIYRVDSKERLQIRYFSGGKYDLSAYGRICWVLRDWKDANQWRQMDLDLINSLWGVQEWTRQTQSQEPWWNITSAYRTFRRNSTIEGAAFNSRHVRGQATDGTVSGQSIRSAAEKARHFRVGGIGQYKTFLHVDSGPNREWVKG